MLMMKRFGTCSAALLLCLAFTSAVRAEAGRENALQSRLTADAADGSLDEFTLWQGALIAGRELDDEQFASAVRRFDAIVDRSKRLAPELRTPEQLFLFMHREVLVGEYRSGQNDLNRLLENGDYNCVTATILYQALCDAAGAETVAIAAPAHVFCRLVGDGDVETTCPTWFAEKARRSAPRAGRAISPVQLIGKIFYNRGVQLLEHERFADALNHLEVSLRFDAHDPTAHANRLAALNNWALHESAAKRFEAATGLLRQGLQLDPTYSPLLANDLHIHQEWVRTLCQQQQEREAIAILLARRAERPDEALFRDGPITVYRLWLQRIAHADWAVHAASLADVRQLLDPSRAMQEERAILGPQRADQLARVSVN